jgi:hypothetical protein
MNERVQRAEGEEEDKPIIASTDLIGCINRAKVRFNLDLSTSHPNLSWID